GRGQLDLVLCSHPGAARKFDQSDGALGLAPGPVLRPEFGPLALARRASIRADLGLADSDRAVVILGGTHGSGDLMETFGGVADLDGFVPIAVCGKNDLLESRLRRMVRRTGRFGLVLGWEDDMAGLMAAGDVAIDNTGGMAAFEAMACSLPVICHLPLPGRRRANVAALAAANLVRYVVEPLELPACLESLAGPGADRSRLVDAGHGLFAGDAADAIEFLARA
ncbi:MAG: hypothetical protein ACRD0E_12135, partial [Acidimicrobiales bacterium]